MPQDIPNVPSDDELEQERELRARFNRIPDGMTDAPPEISADEDKYERRYPSKADNNMKDGLKQYGMMAAIAVLVILILSYVGIGNYATKSYINTKMAEITASLDTALASVSTATAQLNSQVTTMNSQVDAKVTTAVSTATSNYDSELDAISVKVDTLTNSISSLTNNNDALLTRVAALEDDNTGLQSEIDALEVSIAALQTSSGSSSGDSDDIEIDMGYSSYFYWSTGNATVSNQSLAFEITNNTNDDIEDVEVEIIIVTRGVPLNLQNDLCTVVGGYPLQFSKIHVGNGIMVIRGTTPSYGEGLRIDAGDSEYIYFTVNMGVPAGSEPISNITLYVSGSCKDYSVVD